MDNFKIGDLVKGTRTFNGEKITGTFEGFRLYNRTDSNSVVGTIHVLGDRCYDVDPRDISKLEESEDEKMIRTLKDIVNCAGEGRMYLYRDGEYDAVWNWLEKQKDRTWSEEDKMMVEDIIEAIDTNYAASDYNEMVNWLKNLRPTPRIKSVDYEQGYLAGQESVTHWKPNEGDLWGLNKAIQYLFVHHKAIAIRLKSILENLKTL